MADTEIPNLTAITAANLASGDLFVVVDVSDTTQDAQGTAKIVTKGELDTLWADASALAAHIGDTSDAHDASAISYAGGTGMSATDVEAAIDELATEKANTASLGNLATASTINEYFCIACSDEATAITTGNGKATFRMPFALTVTAVRATLTTASSSGTPTIDINDGGTTILSTKLTIDANERTSTTAATPAVISDTALADDAEITIDVDVAGTGATGLKVWIIGTRAV